MRKKLNEKKLIEIYQGLSCENIRFDAINRIKFFKMYFGRVLKNMANDGEYKYSLPILGNIPINYTEEEKEELNKFEHYIRKNHKLQGSIDEEEIRQIDFIFLTESIYFLEHSIYWLLSHTHNLSKFYKKTGDQSLYYSEFFIYNSIARFAGFAITHVSPFKFSILIKRQVDKSNNRPKIVLERLNGRLNHTGFFKKFNEYSEKNVDLNYIKINEGNPIFKGDREKSVYDISANQSYPFDYKYWGRGYGNCDKSPLYFLNGQDGLDDHLSINENNYEDASEYIISLYSNKGYQYDYIGTNITWMINKMKKIGLKRHLKWMDECIDSFEANGNEKVEIVKEFLQNIIND